MIVNEAEITVAQMFALVRVYNRGPIYKTPEHEKADIKMTFPEWVSERVYPAMDCLMVEWAGMYLGIEKDGYTHS